MPRNPPPWWYEGEAPLYARALYPLSLAYGHAVERRFRRATPYRSATPVICIGNLTMGGAGKTPLALKVASLLKTMNLKPGFLTRGYGGSERGPTIVDLATHTSVQVGDEPLLLAQTAVTVVSRDRPAGARLLEGAGVDAIVMDDGFQNPSLTKDLSLIVVDGGAGIGSGHIFPRGPLRARLAFQLSKADGIVIIGENRKAIDWADGARKLPVFNAQLSPVLDASAFQGRWIAFCGIGRPAKFYASLEQAGIDIVSRQSFPDHQVYTENDANRLLALTESMQAGLITTEKDYARLASLPATLALYRAACTFPVRLEFDAATEARLVTILETTVKNGASVVPRYPEAAESRYPGS